MKSDLVETLKTHFPNGVSALSSLHPSGCQVLGVTHVSPFVLIPIFSLESSLGADGKVSGDSPEPSLLIVM